MRNKTFVSLAVASALGLLTPTAHAFGLGKLELYSALNEPFKAEIAVTSLRGDESEYLQVKLASNQEFEKAGLERNFLLSQFEFKVIEKQGKTFVSVSSDRPVKEPLLDFLVIATTGEGRLLREYTVLLDPPKSILAKPKPAKSQVAADTQSTAPKKAKTTTYQYDQPSQSTYVGDTYGPTDRTDTLWKVALNTRPDTSLSVNQMMMALLDANPTAFLNNNINGLKAGHTLDIPSVDAIKQLDKAAAISAVTEQNELWKNRNKVAADTEVASTETSDTAVQEPELDTQVTDVTVDDVASEGETDLSSSELTADDASSRLKLVVPTDEASLNDDELSPQGDDQIAKLSEQLTFAQETIEAQAQENIDFKSRMDAMEEQLETMRRLISLKDADLARLQSLLQEEQDIEAVDGNAEAIVDEALAILNQSDEELELTAENGLEELTTADEIVGDDSGISEVEPEQLEVQDLATVDDEPVAVENELQDVTIPEIDTTGATVEVEDSSMVPSVDDVVATTSKLINVEEQEIQDVIGQVKAYVEENKMTTMLGSLLILLALWLIIRRRNRPGVSWDEAVEKYDIDDAPSTTMASTSSDEPEEEQVEEAGDTTSQVEEANVKTVDDLIKQADMFVGYADYTQAKSSLEQANLLEPDSPLVIAKMLFVLYKQQSADEFINLVEQSNFDSSSEQWEEIAQWGRELAPDNALFTVEEVIEPEQEPEVTEPAEESLTGDDVAEADNTQEDEHLEFNLDDFKADDVTEESEPEPEPELTDAEAADELMSFDTNFELDVTEEEQETESDSAAEFDAPLSLDIDESSSNDEAIAEPDLSLDVDVSDTPEPDSNALELDTEVPADVELQDDLADISEDELAAASQELTNSSDVEFDLGDFDEIDEAETKLDLASAYVDMGDPEGAKSILEEVLGEGNDEQKTRAQKLLNDIS